MLVLVGEVVDAEIRDETFDAVVVLLVDEGAVVVIYVVEAVDVVEAVALEEDAVNIGTCSSGNVVTDISLAVVAEIAPVHDNEVDVLIDDFITFLCSEMLLAQSSFALLRRDEVDSCFLAPLTQSVVGTRHALID